MHSLQISSGFLLLLALLTSPAKAFAGEPQGAIPPDLVLNRFPVARNGGALVIPVNIGGKERQFLVDTGCTNTVVDRSLLPGRPLDIVDIHTADKDIQRGLYALPEASVAGIPLRPDFVIGMDMERLREVFGQQIDGCIGMDFIGGHIVHINWDRGEMLFLKSVPKDAGHGVPIAWAPGQRPEIEAWVTGDRKYPFIIDTGHLGFECGDITTVDTDSLVIGSEFRVVGSILHETASGTSSSFIYQGKSLIMGSCRVDKPVYGGTSGPSVLGLGFWSRFVVTFDFPRQRVYLNKGRDFGRPDRWNSSGLHLIRRSGAVMVHSVDRQSPAERAGLQSGDVLLSIDGLRIESASLTEFRSALCGEGRRLCVVQRNGRTHQLAVQISR
jgi:hypothetical protein